MLTAPDPEGRSALNQTPDDRTPETGADRKDSAPGTVPSDDPTITAGDPIVIDVLGADSTSRGGDLSLMAAGRPAHGETTVNLDGTVTYTPAPGHVGDDAFVCTITNAAGQSATARVEVTVAAAPAAPTLIVGDVAGEPGEPVALKVRLALPKDDKRGRPRAPYEVSVTGLPPAAQLSCAARKRGRLRRGADGRFVLRGTPAQLEAMAGALWITVPRDFAGDLPLEIIVHAGAADAAAATLSARIARREDGERTSGPLLRDGSLSVAEDTALTFELFDSGEARAMGWTVVSHTKPAHGELTLGPDGAASYVPDARYAGIDSFVYTASDAEGGTSSAKVTINVISTETAAAPEHRPGLRWARRGGEPVTIRLFPEGDGDLSVAAIDGPGNGIVTVDNRAGTALYTPNPEFFGTDTFVATIYDRSSDATCSSLVTVNVAEIGAEPADDPEPPARVFSFGPGDVNGSPHAITGFRTGRDGDVLDVSAFLSGFGPDRLHDRIQLADDGFDTIVRVAPSRSGDFRDLALIHGLTGLTLLDLITRGNLRYAPPAE